VIQDGGPPTADGATLAAIARGRALFNRADFWGSHEALEAAWLGAPEGSKPFLQGLIQAAAAFHKLIVQDNVHGARTLLDRALARLGPAPEDPYGLAVRPLHAELTAWRLRLDAPLDADGHLRGLPRLEWSEAAQRRLVHVDRVALHRLEIGDARALLVAVTADGVTGWGECRLAWNAYGAADALGRALIPALLAEGIASPSELPVHWQGVARGRRAQAALEAAVWDVFARRAGTPLATYLGLRPRAVPLAARIDVAEPLELADAARRAVRDGFAQVVLPARPNADRRVLPEVVRGLGAAVAFDLDGAYRRADWYAIRAMAALNPAFVWRPVPRDQLADMGRLRRWLGTPVGGGPYATEHAAADAHRLGAYDVLAVDPGQAGIGEALRMLDLAERLAVPAWIAGRAVTPIGALADLAVAMHGAASLPADLGAPAFVRPNAERSMAPKAGAGIGWAPDGAWLAAHVREHETFVA